MTDKTKAQLDEIVAAFPGGLDGFLKNKGHYPNAKFDVSKIEETAVAHTKWFFDMVGPLAGPLMTSWMVHGYSHAVKDMQAEIDRLGAQLKREQTSVNELSLHCQDLEARIRETKTQSPVPDLPAIAEKLLSYRPGFLPEGCKGEFFESSEDERAPFFSEAYLYNLLGKEEARTVLALMRPLWTLAGIVREDQP